MWLIDGLGQLSPLDLITQGSGVLFEIPHNWTSHGMCTLLAFVVGV